MRRTAGEDGRLLDSTIGGARAWRWPAAVGICAAVAVAASTDATVVVGQSTRAACADTMARTPVRLHLIDRAGLSIATREELEREALRPWVSAGAVVDWSEPPARPAHLGSGVDLYVTTVAGAVSGEPSPPSDQPLASIRFVDERPTTQITVYAGAVARRLDQVSLDDRRVGDRPLRFRDRLLGRVLGRAVAHELGHFLLASKTHTSTGLMRAGHRLENMMAAVDRDSQLVPATGPPCLVARLDGR
jgi:hypothetical protein